MRLLISFRDKRGQDRLSLVSVADPLGLGGVFLDKWLAPADLTPFLPWTMAAARRHALKQPLKLEVPKQPVPLDSS